jgi:hypothetical protein
VTHPSVIAHGLLEVFGDAAAADCALQHVQVKVLQGGLLLQHLEQVGDVGLVVPVQAIVHKARQSARMTDQDLELDHSSL